MKRDLQESLRKIAAAGDGYQDRSVVRSVIEDEANRLKSICRARKLDADKRVMDAITGLLNSAREVALAQDGVSRVGDEIEKRKLKDRFDIEQTKDHIDAIGDSKELRRIQLEKERLELKRLQEEADGKSQNPYKFDDFGEEK